MGHDGTRQVTEPTGPPDTDQPWFVPVLNPEGGHDDEPEPGDSDSDFDDVDGDGDDAPDHFEVAVGTTLVWSPWAVEEKLSTRLTGVASDLGLRLTDDLPELSHQNPGSDQRFGHDQLLAALSNALGALVTLYDGRPLAGDDLATALGAAHDGAVIAAIIAEATGEVAVAQQSAWLRQAGEEVRRAMWRRFYPMGDGTFRVRMRRGERALVRRVVAEQQQRLVEDGPSLAPLFPPGYGETDATSSERSAEFASLTRDDLMATRSLALDRVHASLDDRNIDGDTLAAWMRTLNDIRLVLGTDLGIEDDHQAPPTPWDSTFPTWRTYAVLGNLVHEAVMALRTQL